MKWNIFWPSACLLLEKEVATHSGILAWRIPWSEEPDGLQSLQSKRIGLDWVTNTHTMSSLEKCLIWVFSFLIVLFGVPLLYYLILDTNFVSDIWFAVFHFLDNVIWTTEVFIVMRSVYLFLFCSWCHALGIISKNPDSQKINLMFSNKNFIVLALKFWTMIHFFGLFSIVG